MATLTINTLPREILEGRKNTPLPTSSREEEPGQLMDREGQFASALHAALEEVGERFGLYEVMARSGPVTPVCLATQAGVPELSARIWLEAQTAVNYIHCEPRSNLYSLWCAWKWGGGRRPH